MNRRAASRAEADRKREREKPWRRWYRTKRWKLKRRAQLDRIPWCEPCKRAGRSRPANTADHVIPHRGDPLLFWHGELESQCDSCHSRPKQREELEGFKRERDDDGWPSDPRHPFNKADRTGP